ncbi:MAG: DNA-binding phage protein [Gammaproteobacteria bacterium]|jgi:DNA-binding phage protein
MPTVTHQNADYLGSPEAIVEYLNVVLAENDDDPRLLMTGLGTVAKAMGDIGNRPTYRA